MSEELFKAEGVGSLQPREETTERAANLCAWIGRGVRERSRALLHGAGNRPEGAGQAVLRKFRLNMRRNFFAVQ